MIHLKWTNSQLQQFRDRGLLIDESVDVSDIKEQDKQIRDVSPIRVEGRGDISSSKASFHLHLTGVLTLPCSRTLVDVKYPVDIETTETFLLGVDAPGMEEDAMTVAKGADVDLMPVIKELLLLAIPMQVFCDVPDPEGAAPSSGKDWQVITEEENKQKIDPRLAKLANFFDSDKQS